MSPETSSWVSGYWAKTTGKSGEPPSLPFHPLAWHLLDVAAVGWTLLEKRPSYLATACRLSGIDDAQALRGWLAFLLALHDLGKFFEGFQTMVPELRSLLGKPTDRISEPAHHSTAALLALRSWPETSRVLKKGLRCPTGEVLDRLLLWLRPVFGHHGCPVDYPCTADGRLQATTQTLCDMDSWLEWLNERFLPGGPPAGILDPIIPEPPHQHSLSWWLGGFVSLCDAVGSSEEWFSATPPDLDPDDYWSSKAVPRAQRAIQAIGLQETPPLADARFSRLWPGRAPTPMQAALNRQALGDGPQLWLLEEPTGAGKTEAAMLVAARLLSSGQGRGVYWALPSRATADSMYRRLRDQIGSLFPNTPPSALTFALLHRSAAISGFGLPHDETRDATPGEGIPSVLSEVSSWLANAPRKALLAQVGVGTLDQALLAVLPETFQALRLLGLADKVLIVDEVHAYGAYPRELLKNLLRFHAALGGSAVLLSATLPAAQRLEYLAAFHSGLVAHRRPPLGKLQGTGSAPDYPRFTRLDSTGLVQDHVLPWKRTVRTVGVRLLGDEEECDAVVLRALLAGHCVVWIRNTVGEAQTTYHRWTERLAALGLPAERAVLLHSRYLPADRAKRELELLASFGERSRGAERAGKLVVATQVVEQSLDLDFDEMISDLAPIDRLIQRAGRLHRHPRLVDGDRAPNEIDGRPPAVLHVLSPFPVDEPDADWCSSRMPGTAAVYPDHGVLWLTARTLADVGRIESPGGVQHLVESVYGPPADYHSKVLAQLSQSARTGAKQENTRAKNRLLELTRGYSWKTSQHWPRWSRTTTRGDEEEVAVYFIRVEHGRARRWRSTGKGNEVEDWEASAVSVPLRQLFRASDSAATTFSGLGKHKDHLERPPKHGRFLIFEANPDGVWRNLECGTWTYGPLGLARTADMGVGAACARSATVRGA